MPGGQILCLHSHKCNIKLQNLFNYELIFYKNLVGGTEFQYSFEKSCFSHKLFVTLSSVAVSRQKGRSRVNESFM